MKVVVHGSGNGVEIYVRNADLFGENFFFRTKVLST